MPETTEEQIEVVETEEDHPTPVKPETIADLVDLLDNAYDNAKVNVLITGRGSFGVQGGIQGDYQVTVEKV